MRRTLAISCCFLGAACNRISDAANRMPPAQAYVHFQDVVAAQMLHWGIPWSFPCTKSVVEDGLEVVESLPDDQCVRFSRPQRIKGLWRNDFEGSLFCPAPATTCDEDYSAHRPQTVTWLEFSSELPGREDTPPGGLYSVDFIGRHSQYRGMYGHLGMSNEEILVDRPISIKVVEAPPPGQMTKEHVEAYLKDCAGKSICMPNPEVPKHG